MAVTIGQDAKNIQENEVPSIIAGYAIANDITGSAHLTNGRVKMFDQFTPIGEITSIENPANIDLEIVG